MMTERDVVLTPLPQADGLVKNRPAIILRGMPPRGDLLVCGVSTQLHHEVVGFDEVIRPGDVDFADSGLKAASLIRLGFLAVLPASSFTGAIGSISQERHRRLVDPARTSHRRSASLASRGQPTPCSRGNAWRRSERAPKRMARDISTAEGVRESCRTGLVDYAAFCCAPSPPPRGRNTSSTSRRTPRSNGASR